MKTLVKMKSTEMGKDDDAAITVKYNEGGEYPIGPDLLKAFERKGCVSIVKKPSPTKTESLPEPEDTPKKEAGDPVKEDERDYSVLEQVKKKAPKKKKKGN